MNNSTNYLDSRLDNLRLGTNVTRGQNAPIVHTTYHQPGVNQTISSSTPTLGKPTYGAHSYTHNLAPPTIIASNASVRTPTFQGHISSTNPMGSTINHHNNTSHSQIRSPVYVEPINHNNGIYQPHTSSPSLNIGNNYEPNVSHNIANHQKPSINYEPRFTGSHGQGTPGYNQVNNSDLANIQSRIHREIDDKVKLELEKKELELMLDQEHKRQEDITNYYDQEKRALRDEMWNLEQQFSNVERNLETKTVQVKDIENKISNAASENKNLVQENNNLKDELRKLGEMTNIRVRELDDKLSQNINIVENEKNQYKRDLEGKKIQNAEKVKRMEDEYNRRLGEWQNKLGRANETAFKYDSEINLLKEKMHALNAEARSKVEQVKQRVQEEEARKSASILRALENKLKAMEEEKRHHERRCEGLNKDLQKLEKDWDNTLNPLVTENSKLKQQIEHTKKQIEHGNEHAKQTREDINETERQLQELNADISNLRNKIREAEEINSNQVRQLVDQFRQEKYDIDRRIEEAKSRVIQKERHLEMTEQD